VKILKIMKIRNQPRMGSWGRMGSFKFSVDKKFCLILFDNLIILKYLIV
jgi:hypothetical protein